MSTPPGGIGPDNFAMEKRMKRQSSLSICQLTQNEKGRGGE
jgi:hypothetical protein